MKSANADEIFGFASDEIKSTNSPSRRISSNEVGFHRRRRFHPPARVDFIEKDLVERQGLFLAGVEGFEVASQPLLRCPTFSQASVHAFASVDRGASLRSLNLPPAALATSPGTLRVPRVRKSLTVKKQHRQKSMLFFVYGLRNRYFICFLFEFKLSQRMKSLLTQE